MADVADAVAGALEGGDGHESPEDSRLNTAVAILVAVAATFMALANVKDGNIVQAMQQAQANSVDAWAYYQAKGTKENLAQSTVESLTLARDANPTMPSEVRALYDRSIAENTGRVAKYSKEKDEIKAKAEGYQKQYDALNVHDDQFDMSEALLSVSIALFGVTALTKKRWLLGLASVFAGFGLLLGVAGFANWALHPDFLANVFS